MRSFEMCARKVTVRRWWVREMCARKVTVRRWWVREPFACRGYEQRWELLSADPGLLSAGCG
jgi:hypothetical protein